MSINKLNSIISMTCNLKDIRPCFPFGITYIYIANVIHKVYIPGTRDFQGFNWVVTTKVAHLTGFEKYQSHIVVGCLLFYCVIILPKEVLLC